MSSVFYLRYNSDAQCIGQYGVADSLDQPAEYELATFFQDYLQPLVAKEKQIFDSIHLAQPLHLRSHLSLQDTSYAELIRVVNSFANNTLDLKKSGNWGSERKAQSLHDIVRFFHTLPNRYLSLFQPQIEYIQHTQFLPFSFLAINHLVEFVVQLSVQKTRVLLACYRKQGVKQYLVLGGQFNDREFDTLIPYLFEHELDQLNIQNINLNSNTVNFLADTYFGEFYTAKRQKRGIEDALTRHGYDYSMCQLAPLFPEYEFNILNFEAVFNQHDESPLAGQKDFILGAQADETLQAFKKYHFHAAALANNHALDYGPQSFLNTLQCFKQAGMMAFGGGINQYESNRILEFHYKGKKIALFNGYWSKVNAYIDYEFYALADRPGINMLNGVLLEHIHLYKKQQPDSTVIVFCHWGIDFKPVHSYQRTLSQKLIEAGADLIIGHGPHTLQQVEKIKNKPVIYSIGNGVFNSNGEFKRHQALPYAMTVKFNIETGEVQLYPFLADNLKTFWQPKLVNQQEFNEIQEFYNNDSWLTKHSNALGFYFNFKITG